MKHVVIIGGGFSGCLTAVNLSRLSTGPLKITIINQGYPLGRGIAYSTRNGSHLLNVVARNMSALADQPTHFVEWLRTRTEYRDEPVDRLELDGRTEAGNCLFYQSLLLKCEAQAVVGLWVVRLELGSTPQDGDRVVQVPLFAQRKTKVMMRLPMVRHEFDGSAVAGDCLAQSLLFPKSDTQVVV